MNFRRLRLAMVTAAVGLMGVVSMPGVASAAAQQPHTQVISSRHVVNADYNCEVMQLKHRESFLTFYTVGIKCTGILPGIKVRGTLDIELAPDEHTEWVTHQTLIKGKLYESEKSSREGRSVRIDAERA
jgi:hypothetical protein